MDFTKEQLTLFTNFYTALQENQKDLELKEKYKIQCLEINDKIAELEKKILFRNTTISSFLKGIILEKENTPLNEQKQLIQGGEEMKYRGITIIKNAKCNTWSARPTINGKQIYLSAKTQQECYNKLKIVLNKKQKTEINKLTSTKTNKTITFIEWFEKWKNTYKTKVKKTTIRDYYNSLNHLKDIHQVNIKSINSLKIQEQLNKVPTERTRQKVYELLKMVLEKAEANSIIDNNPIKAIEKPDHKKINGEALSSKDEKLIEQLFINENADAFLVCLYQGLRRGELLAIKRKDIDFEKLTLTIDESLSGDNNLNETKNVYSTRVMPIFKKTLPILEKYKNLNEDERLFTFSYRNIEKRFNKFAKQFKTKYTIHSLRHTFVTRCQEAKIPLHIIQNWAGHVTGSRITQNVYTHVREEAIAENIKIYNNSFD